MKEYIYVLMNAFNFSGRARRQEYWVFQYTSFAICLLVFSIFGFEAIPIYGLCLLIPTLSVSCRRLHDTGRSGMCGIPVLLCIFLFILSLQLGTTESGLIVLTAIAIVFCISVTILSVFFILDGTSGSNRFGDDPKGGNIH